MIARTLLIVAAASSVVLPLRAHAAPRQDLQSASSDGFVAQGGERRVADPSSPARETGKRG